MGRGWRAEDFHDAWNFLVDHPIYNTPFKGYRWEHFPTSLWIDVVKVNPRTNRIEKVERRNTKVEVWLETGPWYTHEEAERDGQGEYVPEEGMPSHDYHLDVGAPTFEEAIIKLAAKVKEYYGDYDRDYKERELREKYKDFDMDAYIASHRSSAAE